MYSAFFSPHLFGKILLYAFPFIIVFISDLSESNGLYLLNDFELSLTVFFSLVIGYIANSGFPNIQIKKIILIFIICTYMILLIVSVVLKLFFLFSIVTYYFILDMPLLVRAGKEGAFNHE